MWIRLLCFPFVFWFIYVHYSYKIKNSNIYSADINPDMFLYKSDRITADSNVTLTQSIYQRNFNIDHLLFSQHPGPCTLHSLTWEGDYTPKFYKRVLINSPNNYAGCL